MRAAYDRNKFVPWRLTEARELLGMSKSDLAERLHVTRGAIAQFESGNTRPSPESFALILMNLNQDSLFFLKAPVRDYLATEISFRRTLASAATAKKISKIKALHSNDVMRYLFSLIKECQTTIPDELYEDNPETLSFYDIEAKAANLRQSWGVGDLPIRNLSTLLENHGIICICNNLPSSVDAFSYWVDFSGNGIQHPVIIQNNDKNYFRQRLTLAHELGHLILHRFVDDDEMERKYKFYEEQAKHFASAFLMPEPRFTSSLYSTTLGSLQEQKRKWGTSVAAIVYRLKELGVLDDNKFRYLQIEMSRRKWKKREPYDDETPREKPYYLNQAFKFAFEKTSGSVSDCSYETGLRMDELAVISGNPELFTPNDNCRLLEFSI